MKHTHETNTAIVLVASLKPFHILEDLFLSRYKIHLLGFTMEHL